jgi:starch phosphorylase
MAKLIIKLIHSVADVIHNDHKLQEYIKIVFLPDYSVSLAELIIPAADLSEQISTAGMEASGTGNMKFALNGALTIGTLDGANVEIREEVGPENIFIFGLTEEQVSANRSGNYRPNELYQNIPLLKSCVDLIDRGVFSNGDQDLFRPLVNSLLQGDYYMVLADFQTYIETQVRAGDVYRQQNKWTEMSIKNTANMGKFSSDRTIEQYAKEIWRAKPVSVSRKAQ